jgi:hypothetical protein
VDQALTREWLSESGQGEPVLRTEMPVLRVINEFMDEKIGRALKERDTTRAFEAMRDLRVVLHALVQVGYPYQSMLDIADDTLDRAAKMVKAHLLQNYLDTPSEERAIELHAMLMDLAVAGYWPSLLQDMDDELWRRETGQRERAC